jgi:hypothetical protein
MAKGSFGRDLEPSMEIYGNQYLEQENIIFP